MRVGVLAMMATFALIALPLTAVAGPATDTDGDGVFDALDNCVTVANASPADCDTDQDGYGNGCDGDFNNDQATNSGDFLNIWVPDFNVGDGGTGTDMNCDGAVNSGDFLNLWVPQFNNPPGPSGLTCAGTVTCP